MKAYELMNDLFERYANVPDSTVDTCKAGDPEKEINKVAVCCIASVDVIEEAANWGADLLITHEPTYHENFDRFSVNDPVAVKKLELIKNTGMTIWRFHDSPHLATPDIIHRGFLNSLGLEGEYIKRDFILKKPIAVSELPKIISDKLRVKNVKLIGASDYSTSKLTLCLGQMDLTPFLSETENDVVIAGEITEWKAGEYARDAALLGFNKTLIVVGHIASERDGMLYASQLIKENHPSLDVKYFESPEIYG